MTTAPSFEEYLTSKKIDSDAFKRSEPQVWNAWKNEFEQVHPNSFTVQKLNLINPVRRKYLLQTTPGSKEIEPTPPVSATPGPVKQSKPVIRPKTN